jgi:hypothetical protein
MNRAKSLNELIKHLENGFNECRWCFAVDIKRIAGKKISRYDFPDCTLIHYSCPRCESEFTEYIVGWDSLHLRSIIQKLHPELEGNVGDEYFEEVNNRVLYPFNLKDYIGC